MARWEIFPRRPWPPGFGHRDRGRSRVEHLDRDQLEFTFDPRPFPDEHARHPREQLRAVLDRSGLNLAAFANWVLGMHDDTLARWLNGARIPECRRNFFSQLEAVTMHGDRLVIVVRSGGLRRAPRRRGARQRTESVAGPP